MFMFEIRIIKQPIHLSELKTIAEDGFGDIIKVVVDVEKEIMAIGGELHTDLETTLMDREGSLRSDTWGINIYPNKTGEDFVEFDSMINLKPSLGNRTRNINDSEIREKIKSIVKKFIIY